MARRVVYIDGGRPVASTYCEHKANRKTPAVRRLVVDYDGATHDEQRPKCRGECPKTRPCPWVSCRYHLSLEVSRNGKEVYLDDRFPEGAPETCALDVAGRGEHTLDEIATAMLLTRERVRQIECEAFEHFLASASAMGLDAASLLSIEGTLRRTSSEEEDEGAPAPTESDADEEF